MKNFDDMTADELMDLMVEKTTLFGLVGNNDGAGIRKMAAEGAWLEHRDDMSRHSLLTMAAMYSCHEAIKALVECGADINGKDNGGNTPLIWAADLGHAETLQLLLDLGADPTVKGRDGETAEEGIQSMPNREKVKTVFNNLAQRATAAERQKHLKRAAPQIKPS